MELHLFYSPLIEGRECFLSPEESRHATRVLRMKIGDKVLVTDGSGIMYEGELGNEDSKKTLIIIGNEKKQEVVREYHLHIAIAPTKNINRFEWFLEKATEIGIDEITPMICEHSERRIIKPERLEKIIITAGKQSFKPQFPKLNETCSFSDFINNNTSTEKYIAYIDTEKQPTLKAKYSTGNDVLILIGPEGDFSREEVELAKKSGFVVISLGDYRLRTETAGIAACHTIALMNQ